MASAYVLPFAHHTVTCEVAEEFRGLRLTPVRMAYDLPSEREPLKNAVHLLAQVGFNRRRMVIYTLYNCKETPEEFLGRVRDLMDWGVVTYPMRFEPLDSLKKNQHVGEHWTAGQLEMVARPRRVIGYGGAFPPYEGLKKKFLEPKNFDDAFSLRPRPSQRCP